MLIHDFHLPYSAGLIHWQLDNRGIVLALKLTTKHKKQRQSAPLLGYISISQMFNDKEHDIVRLHMNGTTSWNTFEKIKVK